MRKDVIPPTILSLLLLVIPLSIFGATIRVSPDAGGEGIQEALDELGVGGRVLLQPGTYLVRQPIILRQDKQTLRGAGVETILFLADHANCPVVVLGDPLDRSKGPTDGLLLYDLSVDGNRIRQDTELWRILPDGPRVNNDGVVVWDIDGATVQDVTCARCRSGGLVSSARARNLTVRGYTAFDNQFDGLACYGTARCRFIRLNLYANLSAGISLDLGFNHNLINRAVLTGNDVGIFMRQSRNNAFERVTIRHSHHDGVFMAQAGDMTRHGWRLTPGTECIGNTFEDLRVLNCGGRAFRVNNVSCTNNKIDGAQFLANTHGGLSQPSTNLVVVKSVTVHP
jgi:hypothetical protein